MKRPWPKYLLLALCAAAITAAAPAAGNPEPKAAPGAKASQPEVSAGIIKGSNEVKADEIKQVIQQILRRPDFRLAQATEARPLPKWLQAIKDSWNRFWDNFAESSTRLSESAPWLPYAIIALAGAVLLLLVWRVISESFFEQKGARSDAKQSDAMTAAKLYSLALSAYADGDFRQAIRLLFRAALLSLFGESARTTPTYILSARLAVMPSAPIDDFRLLKRCFDTTFYGGATASQQDYETARQITLKLRRLNEEVEDEDKAQ